ncbi:MAG: hypothetical protein GY786_23390, partial [Proteobacteria bacterium]|nr:hypothetical protein [Pseudomonadota bacterium]
MEKYKDASTWRPPISAINPEVIRLTDELEKTLRTANEQKSRPPNLNHRQKVGLRRLKNRKGIVIKPADKGSGVCILTEEQYLNEVHRQLNNTLHYSKIDSDDCPQIKQDIKDVVKKYVDKKMLPDDILKIITPKDYR